MWRLARPEDGEEIVSMCLALYREDPGSAPVAAGQVLRDLLRGSDAPAEAAGSSPGFTFTR